MSPLTVRLVHRIRPAPFRAFHSPFIALSASSRLATPPPSSAASIYEKQHDSNPEPHVSSAGTRTYVVSEPDPSNTPYEVPSGAYPTSSSYTTRVAAEREAGFTGAARNATLDDAMGAANTKQGKF